MGKFAAGFVTGIASLVAAVALFALLDDNDSIDPFRP